ncbi:MAG TPA: gluconate 2-dehydrogenase subunit 3 family protein [Woeseiaceae bacterium]|nr:gluconate 2-dehydrogenase subunit 3 family protein [Woeseiaceae bacterium]
MPEMPDDRAAGDRGRRLSRRESLQWLAAMLAGGTMAMAEAGRAAARRSDSFTGADAGHWPALKLPAVTAAGYGTDPDLVLPRRAPWPTTLSDGELATVAVLADILVPREGTVPSASELHVPDVVDEWISAPYAPQHEDRVAILSLLIWLDDEAGRRYGGSFGDIGAAQRLAIVDEIAWFDTAAEFRRPAAAFDRLRRIVLGAFYCTPEGRAELGYLGGQVIAGDYPGPTAEAQAHLSKALAALGLEPYSEIAPRRGV